jgi:hypothetical protein
LKQVKATAISEKATALSDMGTVHADQKELPFKVNCKRGEKMALVVSTVPHHKILMMCSICCT